MPYEYPTHYCPSWPCPICQPHYLQPYVAAPAAPVIVQGCICPPTSEQTCRNTFCPRGGGQPIKIT